MTSKHYQPTPLRPLRPTHYTFLSLLALLSLSGTFLGTFLGTSAATNNLYQCQESFAACLIQTLEFDIPDYTYKLGLDYLRLRDLKCNQGAIGGLSSSYAYPLNLNGAFNDVKLHCEGAYSYGLVKGRLNAALSIGELSLDTYVQTAVQVAVQRAQKNDQTVVQKSLQTAVKKNAQTVQTIQNTHTDITLSSESLPGSISVKECSLHSFTIKLTFTGGIAGNILNLISPIADSYIKDNVQKQACGKMSQLVTVDGSEMLIDRIDPAILSLIEIGHPDPAYPPGMDIRGYLHLATSVVSTANQFVFDDYAGRLGECFFGNINKTEPVKQRDTPSGDVITTLPVPMDSIISHLTKGTGSLTFLLPPQAILPVPSKVTPNSVIRFTKLKIEGLETLTVLDVINPSLQSNISMTNSLHINRLDIDLDFSFCSDINGEQVCDNKNSSMLIKLANITVIANCSVGAVQSRLNSLHLDELTSLTFWLSTIDFLNVTSLSFLPIVESIVIRGAGGDYGKNNGKYTDDLDNGISYLVDNALLLMVTDYKQLVNTVISAAVQGPVRRSINYNIAHLLKTHKQLHRGLIYAEEMEFETHIREWGRNEHNKRTDRTGRDSGRYGGRVGKQGDNLVINWAEFEPLLLFRNVADEVTSDDLNRFVACLASKAIYGSDVGGGDVFTKLSRGLLSELQSEEIASEGAGGGGRGLGLGADKLKKQAARLEEIRGARVKQNADNVEENKGSEMKGGEIKEEGKVKEQKEERDKKRKVSMLTIVNKIKSINKMNNINNINQIQSTEIGISGLNSFYDVSPLKPYPKDGDKNYNLLTTAGIGGCDGSICRPLKVLYKKSNYAYSSDVYSSDAHSRLLGDSRESYTEKYDEKSGDVYSSRSRMLGGWNKYDENSVEYVSEENEQYAKEYNKEHDKENNKDSEKNKENDKENKEKENKVNNNENDTGENSEEHDKDHGEYDLDDDRPHVHDKDTNNREHNQNNHDNHLKDSNEDSNGNNHDNNHDNKSLRENNLNAPQSVSVMLENLHIQLEVISELTMGSYRSIQVGQLSRSGCLVSIFRKLAVDTLALSVGEVTVNMGGPQVMDITKAVQSMFKVLGEEGTLQQINNILTQVSFYSQGMCKIDPLVKDSEGGNYEGGLGGLGGSNEGRSNEVWMGGESSDRREGEGSGEGRGTEGTEGKGEYGGLGSGWVVSISIIGGCVASGLIFLFLLRHEGRYGSGNEGRNGRYEGRNESRNGWWNGRNEGGWGRSGWNGSGSVGDEGSGSYHPLSNGDEEGSSDNISGNDGNTDVEMSSKEEGGGGGGREGGNISHTLQTEGERIRLNNIRIKNNLSPLILHPSLSIFTRLFIPLTIIFNILLFLYSNLCMDAVAVIVTLSSGVFSSIPEPVLAFGLLGTIVSMWEAKVYILSILVAFLSGLWPYIKLISLLSCFILPPAPETLPSLPSPTPSISVPSLTSSTVSTSSSAIDSLQHIQQTHTQQTQEYTSQSTTPHKSSPFYLSITLTRRYQILRLVEMLGKWGLLDFYVMVLMMCAFHLNLEVPNSSGYIMAQPLVLEVLVQPNFGFFSFLLATMLSHSLSHIMLACHRHVVWVGGVGEEGVEERVEKAPSVVPTLPSIPASSTNISSGISTGVRAVDVSTVRGNIGGSVSGNAGVEDVVYTANPLHSVNTIDTVNTVNNVNTERRGGTDRTEGTMGVNPTSRRVVIRLIDSSFLVTRAFLPDPIGGNIMGGNIGRVRTRGNLRGSTVYNTDINNDNNIETCDQIDEIIESRGVDGEGGNHPGNYPQEDRRGNSPSMVKVHFTPSGKRAVFLHILMCMGGIVIATAMFSFQFEFRGLVGWLLERQGEGKSVSPFSFDSVGVMMQEASGIVNSKSHLEGGLAGWSGGYGGVLGRRLGGVVGGGLGGGGGGGGLGGVVGGVPIPSWFGLKAQIISMQLCYFAFGLFAPLLLLIFLIFIWYLPLTSTGLSTVQLFADTISAWTAIDVFCLSIAAALLEIRQFASFVVGDHCGDFDAIAALFLPLSAGPDLTCFDVVTSLSINFLGMIGSAVMLQATVTITSYVSQKSCQGRNRKGRNGGEGVEEGNRIGKGEGGERGGGRDGEELELDSSPFGGHFRPLFGAPVGSSFGVSRGGGGDIGGVECSASAPLLSESFLFERGLHVGDTNNSTNTTNTKNTNTNKANNVSSTNSTNEVVSGRVSEEGEREAVEGVGVEGGGEGGVEERGGERGVGVGAGWQRFDEAAVIVTISEEEEGGEHEALCPSGHPSGRYNRAFIDDYNRDHCNNCIVIGKEERLASHFIGMMVTAGIMEYEE